MFPEFIYQSNQHMPFIGVVNEKPEYLVCMKRFDSSFWKIYRYNGIHWVRLTNAEENVNECNPFVYQKDDGNIVYSWSYQTPSYVGGAIIFETNSIDSKILFDYNSSKYIFKESLYGIDYFGDFVSRIDIKNKFNLEMVLQLSKYENNFLITYIEGGIKKSGIIIDDKIVSVKNKRNGFYLYKPCYFDNEWFSVVTAKNSDNECRFVVKVSEVIIGD